MQAKRKTIPSPKHSHAHNWIDLNRIVNEIDAHNLTVENDTYMQCQAIPCHAKVIWPTNLSQRSFQFALFFY